MKCLTSDTIRISISPLLVELHIAQYDCNVFITDRFKVVLLWFLIVALVSLCDMICSQYGSLYSCPLCFLLSYVIKIENRNK